MKNTKQKFKENNGGERGKERLLKFDLMNL
jgi:hypothetical protein